MISRDDLSPEDRAIYDVTFVGVADRLDRAGSGAEVGP